MEQNKGQFSQREKGVIELLLQGKSNKQIALALGVSESTVEYHLKNIYQKLGVGSRTEAVLRLGKSIGNELPTEVTEPTLDTVSTKVLERRGWLRIILPLLIGLLVLGIVIWISSLSEVYMSNTLLWKLEDNVTLENTTIEQIDGALSLSRQESGAGILETIRQWKGEEIRFVEGTVFVDSRTGPSIGAVTIGIAGFVDDKQWWLSCGIQTYEGQISPQALCSADGGYFVPGVDVSYNSQHTIRIEVDPDSANMTLFVDGSKIDTYHHPNPEAFKKSLLRIQLIVYSRDGDLVSGKFDDIQIDGK